MDPRGMIMGMLPHPGSCPHGQCPFRNIPRLEEDAESDKGDLFNNYPNISGKKQELKKEIEQSARDMLLDSAHSSGRSAELELSVSVSVCVCVCGASDPREKGGSGTFYTAA